MAESIRANPGNPRENLPEYCAEAARDRSTEENEMSYYKKPSEAGFPEVAELATELIELFHPTLKEHRVRVDFLFAFGERDEVTGELIDDALKHHGVKALCIAKKISPVKDRAKGLGDAEICLDADWWTGASQEERKALLDHELTHLVATPKRDYNGRPIIKMSRMISSSAGSPSLRERHGRASQECRQASQSW